MATIERHAGRTIFGEDPRGYTEARPGYPSRVYEILRTICHAGPTTQAFEIGAGTGQASIPMIDLGCHLTAVEPDTRLAAVLAGAVPGAKASHLQVLPVPFETAELPEGVFDLGIAATSFHWLEQTSALHKVKRLLRPGDWWASTSLRRDLALDALEQALYDRELDGPLVHHSDRGGQYLSIRYTERLAEARIEPSVGSRGDSYDNALAETIIGLFKTEVIHHAGPWRGFDDVEYATLEWVSWFNTTRLLEPLGYVPPAEFEVQYQAQTSADSRGYNTFGCVRARSVGLKKIILTTMAPFSSLCL